MYVCIYIYIHTYIQVNDYDGVRWDDDSPITLAFVENMVDRFMDGKTIHNKYSYKLLVSILGLCTDACVCMDVQNTCMIQCFSFCLVSLSFLCLYM